MKFPLPVSLFIKLLRFFFRSKPITSSLWRNKNYMPSPKNPPAPPNIHATVNHWIYSVNFSSLSHLRRVCFCDWLKVLPRIVSICQSIVWMRSAITDLAGGQFDFSWFNWIFDMSQIQTSRDCSAMTVSLLHIKNSFHNALWLWAWQMVKRMESNKWVHFAGLLLKCSKYRLLRYMLLKMYIYYIYIICLSLAKR